MEEKKRSRGWCGWFLVLIVLAAIAFAIFYTVKQKMDKSNSSDAAPVPGPPGAITKKYADALKIATQFLDIQKSGRLVNNQISWRGNSAMQDGTEVKLDLSKGMYDAGDHMKFGFPMAFTATVLSWTILEYGDQMKAVNQLGPVQDSLKWITDYLVNAHPTDNVLYIQVGSPKADHSCWERPEDMTEARPLTQVNTSAPGSDVAAETAAALASASLVFRTADSAYSSLLLSHAKQLFTFADKFRALYSNSIPEVQTFYNSTGYGDELLWAASWLYHATGERSYFEYVTGKNGDDFANWGSPTWFSWDNKLAGTQDKRVFGIRNTGSGIPNPRANRLSHPVASAFLAIVYSDYMLSSRTPRLSCNGRNFRPSDLRKFALSQADYVLGDNPMKMSYLVGYGEKYPQYVHHRGASIPADATTGCKDGFKWLESDDPNPNIAMGALVGGPFLNESFVDSRNNSMQTEPSTYNSAVIVGLLSGLVTTSSVVQSFT
ncbi:endoglucanase 24 [Phtheirospermum japonicum]|uniref:Endoglucanase n=1 Tax=Phtheirospermum japonicum TaxID=374723 RepID=A0A830BLF0_9LAMI|nr:endoglucanase 24 [Phtheirospermum japonicum]